eukprot:6477943-Amphidinium_carterae.2
MGSESLPIKVISSYPCLCTMIAILAGLTCHKLASWMSCDIRSDRLPHVLPNQMWYGYLFEVSPSLASQLTSTQLVAQSFFRIH